MSDTTDDTTTDDGTAPPADDTAPADPGTDDTSDDAGKKARGEAAAYRRRLRDTETERDTIAADRDRLRGLLDDRQRGEVEALAAQRLRDGSDLWTTVELADVLDDQGEVDSTKVTEAVEQLAAAKPHYASARPSFDLGQRGGPVDKGDTFADVLRGRR